MSFGLTLMAGMTKKGGASKGTKAGAKGSKGGMKSELIVNNPIAFLNKYLQVPMIGGESGFVAPSMLSKPPTYSEERFGQSKSPSKINYNSLKI